MSQGPVPAPASPLLDPEPLELPLEPELPTPPSLAPAPPLDMEPPPEPELPELELELPLELAFPLLEPEALLDVEPPLELEDAPELEPPPELEGKPPPEPEEFGVVSEPQEQKVGTAMTASRVQVRMQAPFGPQCVLRKLTNQLIAGRIVPLLVMSPVFASHVAPSM
jgi:hypothetical protein